MIVIPMAGMSSRFARAGYTKPKYELDLNGRTVFSYAIDSFRRYFKKQKFLFIVRGNAGSDEFIAGEVAHAGIADFQIVNLSASTSGQAETVRIGLQQAGKCSDGVTIFNIDTFRLGFEHPEDPDILAASGYLEVFKGAGENWSYVRCDTAGRVVETAEKKQISDLCCTGLYHFRDSDLFHFAYEESYLRRKPEGELYVAPMFNALIRKGQDVRCRLIESYDVQFCGIPEEYENLKASIRADERS